VIGACSRIAADLTDLTVWLRVQLAGQAVDPRQALERAADDISEIAARLMAGRTDLEPKPERDPDLEAWLSRQLARGRSQPGEPPFDAAWALGRAAARVDGVRRGAL
jgi:hypothetical protein